MLVADIEADFEILVLTCDTVDDTMGDEVALLLALPEELEELALMIPESDGFKLYP